jgi:serine/threonine protein kinase
MIKKICNAPLEDGYNRYLDENDEETRLKYAVIKMGDDYYAIYRGNRSLGSGAYGRVKLAQHLQSGTWLALKIQPVHSLIRSAKKNQPVELRSLKKIDAIVRTGPQQEPVHFERYSRSTQIKQDYMLMRYVRGETLEHFQGKKKYPAVIYLNMIIAFLQAVHRVHQAQLIHRDIKLNNAIYDPVTDQCELIDFGLSIKNNLFNHRIHKDFVGTHGYMAPELCKQLYETIHLRYNKQVDTYAAGITIRQLLHLTSVTEHELVRYAHVLFKDVDTKHEYEASIQSHALYKKIDEFTKTMVSVNPSNRPSIHTAINYFNQLRQSLTKRDRIIRVALLNINGLERHLDVNAPAFGRLKAYFQEEAENYDVLWLVTDDVMDDATLAFINYFFQYCGFWVAPVAYTEKKLSPIIEKYSYHSDVPGQCIFAIEELTWRHKVTFQNKLKISNSL